MDSQTTSSNRPDAAKRPIYQTETTGNYWTDVKEAVKRISVRDDLQRINEIPCARTSLLSGIASGAGIGVIRGMGSGPMVACNWAVGTFMLISLGAWTICQKSLADERRKIQEVVESIPRRYAKLQEEQASSKTKDSSATA